MPYDFAAHDGSVIKTTWQQASVALLGTKNNRWAYVFVTSSASTITALKNV